MIYSNRPGLFFGELPDRTANNDVSWGILFNDSTFEVALGNNSLVTPENVVSERDTLELVKVHIQTHIKTSLDQYDRMNEIFNLQIAGDNRNRVIRADPRRARTFIGFNKNSLLEDIFMKVVSVDSEFSQVENLLTGSADIFADSSLFLFNLTTISPMVCYYVSTVLTILDRLRILQENTRREFEKI